jgi:hypothetical protein
MSGKHSVKTIHTWSALEVNLTAHNHWKTHAGHPRHISYTCTCTILLETCCVCTSCYQKDMTLQPPQALLACYAVLHTVSLAGPSVLSLTYISLKISIIIRHFFQCFPQTNSFSHLQPTTTDTFHESWHAQGKIKGTLCIHMITPPLPQVSQAPHLRTNLHL